MGCKVDPKHSTSTSKRRGCSPEIVQNTADYETALDLAGYGRFSRNALAACSCAFFTTGVENCLMSYVLPAARCDLRLTTYHAGLVNMTFMCGGVASAFFWGIIADVFGRRRVLSCTLLLNAILTLAQSTVNDYRILVMVRCINGFLIGGPSTLVLIYLSDLVGMRKRQLYLNLTGMSFVAAWLVLPALAWLILPFKPPQYLQTLLPIHSWRLYLAVSSLPGFVSGIWVLFLPESPRLLADTNRVDKAVKLLTNMYVMNAKKTGQGFKIKTLTVSDIVKVKSLTMEENRTKDLFFGVLKDLKMFVSKMYAWKSSLILFVFFANMAAGFGLNLWIPELLLRMEGRDCKYNLTVVLTKDTKNPSEHNATPAFKETIASEFIQTSNYHKMNGSESIDKEKDEEFCHGDMGDGIFTSGLIVGACCVLGNAACGVLSARGGAKGVRLAAAACALACALASACLAAYACTCSTNNKIAVAAAAALNAASLNGNVLIIRLLLHALPSKLSGLGVCWGAWWGRAGGVASNLAVGALLDLSCPAPFVAVALLLALSVGAIMMIKLENSGNVKKENDVEVANKEVKEKHINLDRYIVTTHM